VGGKDALTTVELVEYHANLECYQERRANFEEHLVRQLPRRHRFLLDPPRCRSVSARRLRDQLILLSALVTDSTINSREESTPVILAIVLTASITSPGSSS